MARIIHLFRTPDRFVAGTVGQPGDRVFYLQASEDGRTVSVSLEKQQVAVLAERLGALLEEVQRRFGADVPAATPGDVVDNQPLEVPLDEEFRVGTMGLGWDAESHAVVIELLAVTEEEVDESVVLDDTEEGPDAVRVFLTPVLARDDHRFVVTGFEDHFPASRAAGHGFVQRHPRAAVDTFQFDMLCLSYTSHAFTFSIGCHFRQPCFPTESGAQCMRPDHNTA